MSYYEPEIIIIPTEFIETDIQERVLYLRLWERYKEKKELVKAMELLDKAA